MTLPDVCPKDGISRCKKKECHLYVVEWRTGDEQCIIGYRSTHKELTRSVPMEDTYAERTRIRLEQSKGREMNPCPEAGDTRSKKKHLERKVPGSVQEDAGIQKDNVVEEAIETIVASPERKQFVPVEGGEIVIDDKDTTVIESRNVDEKVRDNRKRKSLDEMMDLDLPENYEEEFWK